MNGNFRGLRYFNPRSREGSDRRTSLAFTNRINFNPRSREGSDMPYTPACGIRSTFQSTLP